MLKLSIDCLFQEREIEILTVHQKLREHDLRDSYLLVSVLDIAKFQQSLGDCELLVVRDAESGKEVNELLVGHMMVLLEHQVDKANFLDDVDLQ